MSGYAGPPRLLEPHLQRGDPIEVDAGTILADRGRPRSPPSAQRPPGGEGPMAIGHAASVGMLEARYAAANVA